MNEDREWDLLDREWEIYEGTIEPAFIRLNHAWGELKRAVMDAILPDRDGPGGA